MNDTIFINFKNGAITSETFMVVMQIAVDEPNTYEKNIITNQVGRLVDGIIADADGDDWVMDVFFAESGYNFIIHSVVEDMPDVFCECDKFEMVCKATEAAENLKGWVAMKLNGYS